MKHKFNTLKLKIIIYIFPLFLLFAIILNLVLHNITVNSIGKITKKNIDQLSLNFSNEIENYSKNLDEIYYQLHLNYKIEDFINESLDISNISSYSLSRLDIVTYLTDITIIKPFIVDAFIVNTRKEVVAQRGTLSLFEKELNKNGTWFKDVFSSKDIKQYSIIYLYNNDLMNPKKPILLLTRKIVSFNHSKALGFLTICIDFDAMQKVLNANKLYENQIFCILDKDNNILYPANLDKNIRDEISTGKSSSIIIKKSALDSNIAFVSYIPEKYVNGDLNRITFTIWILTSGFTIAVFLIVYFISVRVSRPLNNLAYKMNNFKFEVDFNSVHPGLEHNNVYEVQMINSSFISMVEQIQRLIENINKKNKDLMNAEISALQSQINPHFIYHSLNTILWISRINKIDSISKLVTSLVNLLQVSIYNSEQYITVEEELANISSYIYIENFRFNLPVMLETNLPSNLLGVMTLKLVLQPIVENCIAHGFYDEQGDKRIEISGCLENDNLILTVQDNGKGIEESVIDDILKDRLKTNRFSGIGIKNVIDRIKLRYGERYGISIISEIGKGTQVVIIQPVIRSEIK